MKRLPFLLFLLLLLYSKTLVNGQTYSGPSTGSVDAGATVTTDDFILTPGNQIPLTKPNVRNTEYPDSKPLFYNGKENVFDNYIYVEDSNINSLNGGEIGINFVLNNFPANTMTNFIPPDPAMAVGPNHIITTVNGMFSIWDREGNLLKNIDPGAWFLPVSPYESGDPQVFFDHYENRWFMLYMGLNTGIQFSSNLIAYSDDDNPLGTWYIYSINTKMNGTFDSDYWGDYPHIGYDDQAIYITTNCFAYSGHFFAYPKIRIINKSELYAAEGGPLTWTDFWDITLPGSSVIPVSIQPAISFTASNNTGYLAWNNRDTSNFYVIYRITDPITNPVLTAVSLPVPTYFPPPSGNQLGGGTPIANLPRMTSVPIVRNNKLYAVHTIQNTQFSNYSSLKYWIADVNTNTVLEQVEQGAQGLFYLFPSIVVDQDNNLAITYSRSADTEYIGAYYSTKLGTDPPGLSPSKVMIEGQGNYDVTFGGSSNRWGDYLAAALDPANGYNIWLFSEYASNTNQWGTWLTEIRMKPFPGVSAHTLTPDLELGNIEVNTTSNTITAILANYGDQDLVISDIPLSMGDFSLDPGEGIMFKYVSTVAGSALAVLAASPVSADHKGPCHGQGCMGNGDLGTSMILVRKSGSPRDFRSTASRCG